MRHDGQVRIFPIANSTSALFAHTVHSYSRLKTDTFIFSHSAASGAAIAKCLSRRLTTNTGVTDEVVKTVRKVLGGSSSASDADVGATITDVAISQSCMGDGDAWKFDSYCWGEECSDCEGDTECKAACLAVEACNWKPTSYNQTACNLGDWENCNAMTTQVHIAFPKSSDYLPNKTDIFFYLSQAVCEANTGDYCLGTTDWGSSEDLSQAGYCSPSVPAYYGKYDDTYTWDYDSWRSESMHINDTVCATIGSGITATAIPWDKHSTDPAKQCTFSGANMNSVKDTCLDQCTGASNGFQPAARYQCYKEPNATTGKCSTTGFFTVRQEDWNFYAPEGVSRPVFCVAEYWGPNNLFETHSDPNWDPVTGTGQTNVGWHVVLQGDGTNSDVTAGTYNLVGTDWEAITGFSWWEGLSFTTEAQANKVCTDTAIGASVREVDDGSQECYDSRCWFDTTGGNAVTNQNDCNTAAVAASGTTDGFDTEWRTDMGGAANGVCSFVNYHIRVGPSNAADKFDRWSKGPTATTNFKTLCDAQSGATFYVGRRFQEGVMDTSAKCDAQYCNIVGKSQDVDTATCTSLGGVCKTRGLGCGGCRKPSTSEVTTPLSGMCYSSGVQSSGDCSGVYANSLKLCRFDDVTSFGECNSPNKWLTCENIDDAVCGATNPSTVASATTLHGYASAFLGCKETKEKTFCKTQEQCETETGACSSHWGPQLKGEMCTWNNTDYTETCVTYDDVCVTDKLPGTWECLGHTCVGNPNTQNQTYFTTNSTGHSVEVTETYCWDEKRESVNHDQCVDYYVETKSACDAVAGTWLSTTIASQESFCTSAKTCVGGRTETGWTGERDATQCLLCGGRMVSESSWMAGTWVDPAMVASGNLWQARAYAAGVNAWSGRIDRWRVQDLLQSVEQSLNEEAYSVFARCQYGQVGESLEQLASVCSGLDLTNRTKVLDKASTLLNNMTAFNGTAMTIGNREESNLETSANSTNGDASYTVDTAIVRVTTDNTTLAAICLGTFSAPDAAVEDTSNSTNTTNSSARRRKLQAASPQVVSTRRKLTQAETDDASLQDAGCWSKVRNADGVLVGQLLGDCMQVTLGVGQQLLDGIRACLKTKPERPFGEGYTTDALVKRTTVGGVDVYTPVDIAVDRVGAQICGKITDVGSFFCPARITSNWATATTDVGTTECPIVVVIAAAREAAIAQIRREQLAAKDDGVIEGLDETSGAVVLGAICLFILMTCCGCARWFVVRRRRRRAREDAHAQGKAAPQTRDGQCC